NRSRRGVIRRYLELRGTPLRMVAFFLVGPRTASLRRRSFIVGPLDWTAPTVSQTLIAVLTMSLSTSGSATVLFTALMPQATPKNNRASALASWAGVSAPSSWAFRSTHLYA